MGHTVRVAAVLPRDNGTRTLLSVECNITGGFYAGDRENPPEGPEVEPVRAWIDMDDVDGEESVPLPRPELELRTLSAAELDTLADLVYGPAVEALKEQEADALAGYDDDRYEDELRYD